MHTPDEGDCLGFCIRLSLIQAPGRHIIRPWSPPSQVPRSSWKRKSRSGNHIADDPPTYRGRHADLAFVQWIAGFSIGAVEWAIDVSGLTSAAGALEETSGERGEEKKGAEGGWGGEDLGRWIARPMGYRSAIKTAVLKK